MPSTSDPTQTPALAPAPAPEKDKDRTVAPTPAATLAEQKSDFTSEGAPPPGKVVSTAVPATPDRGRRGP
jgi:hypothetical protein